MLAFLITIIKLLVIIVVVTTIHEFGHFLASKLLGVGVDEFAVGFGPKIFQKKYKGTVYTLRCLPFGGYCAIEGEGGETSSEDEENKKEEPKEISPTSYQAKGPIQKIIILSMGVIFNFILATIVFLGVYLPGDVLSTEVTSLYNDSVLVEAGLQNGDIITSLNGKKVELYSQISEFKLPADQFDMEVTYLRDGVEQTALVKNAQVYKGKVGITFNLDEEGKSTNVINMVGNGTPAASAGLKAGDKIVKIAEKETSNARDVIMGFRPYAGTETTVEVMRDEQILTFNITPNPTLELDLGIEMYGTVKSNLKYAFIETYQNIKGIVLSYATIFTGETKISNMSGIIGIGEVVSKSQGLLSFFNLLAMISMAVGVANILPFPPLDGGKIVLVAAEGITKKKVPEKFELALSYAGLFLLLALTVFVSIKDIIRII